MTHRYHHGDLPATLLHRAAEVVAESGSQALSLRALAAEVGVSHTAPRHHFGSRDGLLTALAAEGFDLLADAMVAVRENGGSFEDSGVAYVRFALAHPGHFAVMYDPDVLLEDDPDLVAAEHRAFAEVLAGVETLDDPRAREDMAAATLVAWSTMHGLVTLQRSGALARSHVTALLGDQPLPDLAARIAQMLYSPPPPPEGPQP